MAFPAGPTFTPTTTSSAVFFKRPGPVATIAPIQTSIRSWQASQLLRLLKDLYPLLLLALRCLKHILSSTTWRTEANSGLVFPTTVRSTGSPINIYGTDVPKTCF